MFRHAIILSAGKGSRLLPLTENRPKCLIEFSGRTLLDWQLDALATGGIEQVTVVTGFRADLVEAVAAARTDLRVEPLFNPFFHVAENVGSVWMARAAMTGDFLILNGDTLIGPDIVSQLLKTARDPITVTVDEKPAYDEDDMKVVRGTDGRLARIGKLLPGFVPNAESIGFLAFRDAGGALFRAAVEDIMRTPAGTTSWYLKVIDTLAATGQVGTTAITGHAWAEVDYPADLAPARALTDRWAAAQRRL